MTSWLAVVTLFVLSACGIAFQLLLAAVAGYLDGESLLLLCAIVGVFLTAMGLGAHLSRRVRDPAADGLVAVAIVLGTAGGVAPTLAGLWASQLPGVAMCTGIFAAVCGGALGAAIPLGLRLAPGKDVSGVLALVLAVDYIGALAGSLLLPLAVLPAAGHARGATVIGFVALLVAALCYVRWRAALRRPATSLAALCAGALAVLACFLHGPRAADWAFERMSHERVLHRERSPYQEILLSEGATGVSLRLNGQIQFNDAWEKPYHEALVHPALSGLADPRDVLVLGGGDGLALREIWRYPSIRRVVLVDLDPRMVALARTHPKLIERNGGAFEDPRVHVLNEDAFLYVQRASERFDAILIDLPQPTNISLSKLYTVEFYRDVRQRLREGGLIALQSEEVEMTRGDVLWCITRTLRAAGLYAQPYVTGSLGYNLAASRPFSSERLVMRHKTDFLTTDMARAMFALHGELREREGETNRLENHALLGYVR